MSRQIRSVAAWAESKTPQWMALSAPRRPGRTRDAFRFATAAALRLMCRFGERIGTDERAAGGEPDDSPDFFALLANDLDDVPMQWGKKEWKQFNWFTRHHRGTGFGSPEEIEATRQMVNVAGAAGFNRLLEVFHAFIDRDTPGGVSVREEMAAEFDRAAAGLVREVFGTPTAPGKWSNDRILYRWPPRLLPAEWCTDTVTTLARQMWGAREFSAMPILADALQDAGCDRADVLEHCRDPGATHCRGCWVLDAILSQPER